MNRAIRRHHKFRKRQHARRVMQVLLGNGHDQYADKNAEHLKKCSCWMCGNYRKWHGKTRAEKQQHGYDDGSFA